MAKRKQRGFTTEFKAQAVRVVRESGKPVRRTAEKAGMAQRKLTPREKCREPRDQGRHDEEGFGAPAPKVTFFARRSARGSSEMPTA
jgi:transposase-like protein